jgi:hypothetical protein
MNCQKTGPYTDFLAQVRGGYTIAPLREYKLENSPESLITCIIKVRPHLSVAFSPS